MTEATATDLRSIPFQTADGGTATLADYGDQVLLVVNVASKCGLTPQYEQLEALQRAYADRGFTVLGFPCNQFLEQEPGTADEIQEFCSVNYGVTFPLFEKIEVNGDGRHEIYRTLTEATDEKGDTGDVQWNFEKYLVSADGAVVARFSPKVEPDDERIVGAIEAQLG